MHRSTYIIVIILVSFFVVNCSSDDKNKNETEDSNSSSLYGSFSFASVNAFYKVNPISGKANVISSDTELSGYPNIRDLAFDPNTGFLYGIDRTKDNLLIKINSANGESTLIGKVGNYPIFGLAFDPDMNILYGIQFNGKIGWGVDTTTDRVLVRINTVTGKATEIGKISTASIGRLAYDTNTDTLYSTNHENDTLIKINTNTGQPTTVGAIGFDTGPITFDSNSDTLYGTASVFDGIIFQDQIIAIDTTTGQGTGLGKTGSTGIWGLAYDPITYQMYGFNGKTKQLITISPATGDTYDIGLMGMNMSAWSLAYNPKYNTFYSINDPLYGSMQLISIDAITGKARLIAETGLYTLIESLAFDPNTETLYGAGYQNQQLYKFDTTIGTATAIGNTGFATISGLAFDPNTNTLYGVADMNRQLITIDTATGIGTVVGDTGISIEGLSFDPVTNKLYGSGYYELIAINTKTGAGTKVTSTVMMGGLAFSY